MKLYKIIAQFLRIFVKSSRFLKFFPNLLCVLSQKFDSLFAWIVPRLCMKSFIMEFP